MGSRRPLGDQRKRFATVSLRTRGPVHRHHLDELAADRDPAFRRRFYETILSALRDRQCVALCATYDSRYLVIADQRYTLRNGRLTPQGLTRRHLCRRLPPDLACSVGRTPGALCAEHRAEAAACLRRGGRHHPVQCLHRAVRRRGRDPEPVWRQDRRRPGPS